MTNQIVALTGPVRQLSQADQPVTMEQQPVTRAPAPLVPVQLPEGRSAYQDTTQQTAVLQAQTMAVNAGSGGGILAALPIVQLNQYVGGDKSWQSLLEWDIPVGFYGDLHEIALSSSDDAHTRYQIILANINQNVPTDRPTSTPLTMPWRQTAIPGGTSVIVRVLSTDGTAITVDGALTATLRGAG